MRALTLAALLAGTAALAHAQTAPVEQGPPNVPSFHPAFPEQTRAPAMRSEFGLDVAEVATGLEHPWGLALLPDGGYLVTERPGRLRVVSPEGVLSEAVAGLPEVRAAGQGGLLDVAVSPTFATDRVLYLTYARPMQGGTAATAALRGRLSEDLATLTDVQDVFVQDPPVSATNHFGARIVPDGEGHLFVTTGDRFTPENRVRAQDPGATFGKVVRIALDGTPPPDNPFVGQAAAIPTIWSLGHRNIQGAALDGDGRLWTVEHGPRGGDELNLVEPGANYGWPVISYGVNYDGTPVGDGITAHDGLAQPRYYWDPVIAPGGMTFYDGAMFPEWRGDALIGAMNPGALVRLALEADTIAGEERLLTDLGRIRDVAVAPDGSLLLLIDAENGRLLRVTRAVPPTD